MPIPLQPLITLPPYDRPYTYIKLSVRRNEKNEKAAAGKKTNSATLRENLTFKLNSVTESVDPQISSQQQLQNNGKFPN
jgi:hypothetical protein